MTTRIGTFCFRYRWWVLLAWAVAMVAGIMAAPRVFGNAEDAQQLRHTEAGRAATVLDEHTDEGRNVIGLVEGVDPSAKATRTAVADAVADIKAVDGVKRVTTSTADDRSGVAIDVTLRRFADDKEAAEDKAYDAAKNRLTSLEDQIDGAKLRLGGETELGESINDAVQEDLFRTEFTSLPLTLIVMVFLFGGLVAASVPVLAALVTVACSFAGLLAFSTFIDIGPDVMSVISLLGLGLCIDYSLLLVARYREELAAGHDRAEAIGRTWGTAGRTVAFSALTVAASLVSMLVFDVPRLQQFGAAAISAAAVAMITALTFTAAVLGVFGRAVRPSKRDVRREEEHAERGLFAAIARFCQHRPLAVTLATGGVLVVAALPLLGATIKLPNLEALPRSLEPVAVTDQLADHYGRGSGDPVRVVARTDTATLDAWARGWGDDPEVKTVKAAESVGPNLSTVTFSTRHGGQSDQARELVHRMRADRPSEQSWVTGQAAVLDDLMGKITDRLPLALGVTVGIVFVLLFLMTGSLVVPVKVIVTGALSLGATIGTLVMVFQHGWLSGPLDTLTVGGLSPFMLVMVLGFAFGLSMDYEVFLLGRIKEHVDAGHPTSVAVRMGLQRSGRVITSAALLMLILFAFFAAAKVGDLEEIGLGIFIAVLVDATLVRCLLVPATMTLLDKWNWWAPAPLRRLHARFGLHETAPTPAKEPAAVH